MNINNPADIFNSSLATIKRRNIFILLLFIFSLFINPLVSIIFSIGLYFKSNQSNWFIVASVFFISLIQSTTQSTGSQPTDIVNYYAIFGNIENIFGYRINGIFYYFLSFSFKNLFGNDSFRFFVFSLFFGINLSFVFLSLSFSENKGRLLKSVVLIFGILNFVQGSELIRQNLGQAIFLWGLFFWDKKKIVLSVLAMALSLLTHQFSIVPIGSFMAAFVPIFILTMIPVCLIFSLFDHNKLIMDSVCQSNNSGFCRTINYYSLIKWNITLREHLSVFLISLFSFFSYLFQLGKRKVNQLNLIDRFLLVYLLVLLSSLSTPHSFIRFLNSSFPFFAIIFCRLFDSFRETKYFKLIILFISTLWFGYNAAGLYKRITRDTYQSSFLNNKPQLIFKNSTLDYFKVERDYLE